MMIAALANAGAVFRNTRVDDGRDPRLRFRRARAGRRRPPLSFLAKRQAAAHGLRRRLRAHGARRVRACGKRRATSAISTAPAPGSHVLNEHFWDMQNGGYFYTADESDPLIVRSRMIYDQATPSANGVMVSLLARMHLATWQNPYRDRCNALIEAFSGETARAAASHAFLPCWTGDGDDRLADRRRGPGDKPEDARTCGAVMGRSLPNRTLVLADPGADTDRRTSRIRQENGERATHGLYLPARDLLCADHQSGDAQPGAATAAATRRRPGIRKINRRDEWRDGYHHRRPGRQLRRLSCAAFRRQRTGHGGHSGDFRRQQGDARHRRRFRRARLLRAGARSLLAPRARRATHATRAMPNGSAPST